MKQLSMVGSLKFLNMMGSNEKKFTMKKAKKR